MCNNKLHFIAVQGLLDQPSAKDFMRHIGQPPEDGYDGKYEHYLLFLICHVDELQIALGDP